jgi:hypothetical protein
MPEFTPVGCVAKNVISRLQAFTKVTRQQDYYKACESGTQVAH